MSEETRSQLNLITDQIIVLIQAAKGREIACSKIYVNVLDDIACRLMDIAAEGETEVNSDD